MEYIRTLASVSVLKLDKEIKDSAIGSLYTGMSQTGSEIVFYMNKILNPVQISFLDQLIADHNPEISREYVKGIVVGAMTFGANLIAEYSTTRVLRGTTDEQTLEVLEELWLLQAALISGSLKAARLILLRMEPSPLIPQADIEFFLHKINVFLGIV